VDAHKKVFEIFPQQSLYTSVLCGSLSLIIQVIPIVKFSSKIKCSRSKASVNHEDIAETLSNAVTDIAIETSMCVELLDVIRTPAMREQLSRAYALMFRFYRDAIEWYLSSTRSKFFGSFNERLKTGFEDSAKAIKEVISRMFNMCHIGTAARLAFVQRDVAFSKAEILRQRQNSWAQNGSRIDPGEFMQACLKAMYQSQAIENPEPQSMLIASEERTTDGTPESKDTNDRSQLLGIMRQTEPYIVGDEGHSLFGTDEFWMPDLGVVPVLQDWMAKGELPRTLWISGPAASNMGSITSPQAAALNVVLAAWKVHSPIISHFCARPHHGAESLTCEQAGMIGLVYSLIMQLLQFKVEDDQLDFGPGDIARLDGSSASFSAGLKILYRLFVCTPDIRFCVVHNLNALEWGGGVGWCHDFLDVLFRAQAKCQGSFKILLTTSGSSRVLAERIPARSQCFAEELAHQVPLQICRSE
jgi:hypothetical protein